MKEKFFKICEKYLVGGYSIKIGKKYLNFNKLGPVFTFAFLVAFTGDMIDVDYVEYIGYSLMPIVLLGMFYYKLFPSRKPKNFLD